jgi:alkaline phosphatase
MSIPVRGLLFDRPVAKTRAISRGAVLLIATIATAVHTGCAFGSGASGDADAATGRPDAAASADAGGPTERRVVILMIGDGMGRGQLDAASRSAYGAPGMLRMQSMPSRGDMITGSLSGITDSAAAATAMATGAVTFNARIGVDRDGAPVETLVELAQRRGLGTGVVTTSALPHATPGAFTAHQPSRHDYVSIAAEQALSIRPDVMIGGGMDEYAALLDAIAADGTLVVTDLDALAAAEPSRRVFGVLADRHMEFVLDAATEQPSLRDMTMAAIDRLDPDPDGFFLMVEGARIDMASHGNDLERAVGETLAFDDAVAGVLEWADARDDVTVVVTADHECGGLDTSAYPDIGWRWGNHTNARVDVFAHGPGAGVFDGAVSTFPELHASLAARVDGRDPIAPPPALAPDGHLADLPVRVAEQAVASGFGAGFNQLDALYAGADDRALAVGIEGVFEWGENAVVVLIDVDPGAGTGIGSFSGAIADTDGRVDGILAALQADLPAGFGADFALVSAGGMDPHIEDLWTDGGLRRLDVPANLPWLGAPINFGERTRTAGTPVDPTPGEGFEAQVTWSTLYGADEPPPGARIGVAAILVNSDGGYASNQALPPFAPGTANPGRTVYDLPMAELDVDALRAE